MTAQADRPGYDPISSTLWRQREEYCARMIQSVWRRQTRLELLGLAVPPAMRSTTLLDTRMSRMRSGAIVEVAGGEGSEPLEEVEGASRRRLTLTVDL